MTDEYRLLTTRTRNGQFYSELTLNGGKIDQSNHLRDVIAEMSLSQIRYLTKLTEIDWIGFIISGKNLK